MSFYRRMMRVPWTDKKSNEDVLKEANANRDLVIRIRKRQSTFFGHVMRREKLEHLVTAGRLEGKRDKGQPREMMLDSLALWHSRTSIPEMSGCTRDRRKWKDMIVNVTRPGS